MRRVLAGFMGLAVVGGLIGGCGAKGRTFVDPAEQPYVTVVARTDFPPGNPAVSPDGRLFVSVHPFGNPTNSVREILPDGSSRVFPAGAWGGKPGADGIGIASVIGIECGRDSVLWMLDMGGGGLPPRLIGWDLKRDELHKVIRIESPASVAGGFPQDFAIDDRRGMFYIADMGLTGLGGSTKPAIIVVDRKTGAARRVLEHHPALRAEAGAVMTIDGKDVMALDASGKPFRPSLGLNPITIDHESRWVFFGAMHGRSLYRIPAKALADERLSSADLAATIVRHGDKPVSDGITVAWDGTVYVTDVNANAIGATTQDGYRVRVQDDALLNWPDGLSFGPDGSLYATVNQLHRFPNLNGGINAVRPPFCIVRIDGLHSKGVQGR